MKYCFNYNKNTEHMQYINEANEWTIKYNSKDTTLLDFLDLHKDKRINIYVSGEEALTTPISLFEELCKKYNNIYLKLDMKYFYKKDKKYNFKFFFDELVNDWDVLIGLLKYGVTDIYIVENLGFELDKVAEIAAQYNAQVRVYPNVAQSKFETTPPLKKFFIRPEDIKAYEEYIDILEFFDADTQLDTYYKIYAIDKKWFGKLNEIIKNFNFDIDNKYIIPRFGEKRRVCNKKCLKGGICSRCDNIEELAKTLEQSKIVIWNDEK